MMIVAGLIIALSRAGVAPGFTVGDRIALVEINGVILDDEQILRDLRRFRRDGSVRGYVVSINSPGGGVGASQSIYRELRRIRDDDERPVVASIAGMGASGGYYIALAADSIYVLPGSVTGSIGVIMELPDASQLMDRIGIRFDVVKSAEHKDMGSLVRPLSPEDREILEGVVTDAFEQFVEAVATERGLEPGMVERVADGRILTGRQALELGLVDAIGNLHDAFAAAGRMTGLGDQPRIATPPRRRGVLDLLLGQRFPGTLVGLVERVGPVRESGPRLKYVVPF